MSGGEPQIGLGLGLEMGVQIWGQLGSTGDYVVVLSFGMAWSASLDSFCVSAGVEEGFLVNAVTANGHGASKQSGESPPSRRIVGSLGLLVWAGCCLSLPPASPPRSC